jgi:hypothetical protein
MLLRPRAAVVGLPVSEIKWGVLTNASRALVTELWGVQSGFWTTLVTVSALSALPRGSAAAAVLLVAAAGADRLLVLYRSRVLDRFYPARPFGRGKSEAHWLLDEGGAIRVAASARERTRA